MTKEELELKYAQSLIAEHRLWTILFRMEGKLSAIRECLDYATSDEIKLQIIERILDGDKDNE